MIIDQSAVPWLLSVGTQMPVFFSLYSVLSSVKVNAELGLGGVGVLGPELTKQFPAVMESRFELVTKSGERLTARGQYPKGHARNPMSDADVEAKFRSACAPHMSVARCDGALDLLWGLDDLASVGDLVAVFDVG